MPCLLDSDVLIDISRNRQGSIDYVDTLADPWNDIAGDRDGTSYELLLRYAKSHGLQVFDSLIAATAIERGFTLVTKNHRHFAMIGELIVQVPCTDLPAGSPPVVLPSYRWLGECPLRSRPGQPRLNSLLSVKERCGSSQARPRLWTRSVPFPSP